MNECVRTVDSFKYIAGCEGGVWAVECFRFLNR